MIDEPTKQAMNRIALHLDQAAEEWENLTMGQRQAVQDARLYAETIHVSIGKQLRDVLREVRGILVREI